MRKGKNDMKSFGSSENRSTGSLLSFRDRFAVSPQFEKLYREGMALVDETAEYLDGAGRAEARRLTPPASFAYTSESIKLTTRLTQLASWLLVRRAISMGEITAAQAHTHRHRVNLVPQSALHPDGFSDLPDNFRRLIGESQRLHDRVVRLDRLLNEGSGAAEGGDSPLNPGIERIRLAFPAA
jgi:regulator of CtrA degradation